MIRKNLFIAIDEAGISVDDLAVMLKKTKATISRKLTTGDFYTGEAAIIYEELRKRGTRYTFEDLFA